MILIFRNRLVKTLSSFLVFLLVFNLSSFAGIVELSDTVKAEGTKVEETIHTYNSNTWAYNTLAKGPNGEIYLAHVVSGTEIAIKQWNGNSWDALTSVTVGQTGDTGFGGSVDLVVSSDGKLHLVFQHHIGSGVNSHRGIKYGVFNGTNWSFKEIEAYSDPNGWKNFSDPAISVDSRGNAHIVYNYTDSNGPRKYAVNYATNSNGPWNISSIVIGDGAPGIDEIHDPQIGIDGNDIVHVSYVREDNQNDYYGNYYYTSKIASAENFPTAVKLIDAVEENKNYYYSPLVVDDLGNLYFTSSEAVYNSEWEFSSSTVFLHSKVSGNWQKEQVYKSGERETYPVGVYVDNSKVYMLMDSYTQDSSEEYLFAMANYGNGWIVGNKNVLPDSVIGGITNERTYLVDSNGNFMLVMLHDELKKISSLFGTSEDFGLSSVEVPETYTVLYDGNGNDAGSVPVDGNNYTEKSSVTVPNNIGNLKRTGYMFAGWNTNADGTGIDYVSETNFEMGNSNVILYAKWIDIMEETISPTILNDSISAADISTSGVTLNWSKASDDTTTQAELEYQLYQSTTNNIDTVSNIETNGTALGSGFTKDITTFDVKNLEPNATYYFNVIVKDAAGNKSSYTMQQVKTLSEVTTPGVNVTIGVVTVGKGMTEIIPVTINTPTTGIASYGMKIDFDPNVLEVLDIIPNDSIDGLFDSHTSEPPGTLGVGWVAMSGGDFPISSATELFKIKVKVKSNAELGNSALTIDSSDMTNLNFTDNEMKEITSDVLNGFVHVVNSYEMKFEVDGGSEVDSQFVMENGMIRKPVDPTKSGYSFAGWYTDNSFTTEFDFNKSLNESKVVYAKWISRNASLSNLTLSAGSLSPTFAASTEIYTTSVGNSVSSIKVTPTVADNKSTVKVKDMSVISGQVSGDIELNVGANNIPVVVTAEDDTTTKTYHLTVYRLAAAPAVIADDVNNVIIGLTASLEYQINGGPWIPFHPLLFPDLNGNKTVKVRIPANPTLGIPASEEKTLIFTENLRDAYSPKITNATTVEDEISTNGLVITPNAQDTNVTHFKISEITGGTLYQNDGATPITNDGFITKAIAESGLKFKPATDTNSSAGDIFSFSVQAAYDTVGTGLSGSTKASIIVTEVNDTPIASDDTLPTIEGNTPGFTIPFYELLSNDFKGPTNENVQTLTITSVDDAEGGSVIIQGTDVIFTPLSGFRGKARFSYTIQDNGTTNSENDFKTNQATVELDLDYTKKPIITLVEGDTVYWKKGTTYTEPGFTANDEVDGDLTEKVVVTGSVDHNQLGTYLLKYNVSDNSGNVASEVTRTVRVVSSDLKELTVSAGDIVPSFDPQQLNYTLTVPFNVYSVNVTASTLDPTASIVVGGVSYGNSGTLYLPLIIGEMPLPIVVEAEGGDTTTYLMTVKRDLIPPMPILPLAPNVTGDDATNKMIGADSTMEYLTNDTGNWTVYDPSHAPTFTGNGTVQIRVKADGTTPAGEITTLRFTENAPVVPSTPAVTIDDATNKLVSADETMEYSTDGGDVWTSYDPNDSPTFTGNVTVQIRVKANETTPAGLVTTVLFTKNPASVPNPTPTPSPTPAPTGPTTEQVEVDVDGEDGTNLTKTPVTRTTEPNGTVKDKVAMTETLAKEIVVKAKQQGVDTARIVIPDTKDKVAEIKVDIPKSALKQLNNGNLKLEIVTDNGVISIPTKSISGFAEDLYFRIVPMKTEQQRKLVEERAKKEEIIQDVARNQTVQVLGRPMEIETNMQSREVSIVLPLKDSLPSDANKRQEILDNLGVFIEHSDGTKELMQGKLIKMKDGSEGIEFTVTKFSTFTLIYMDGWKEFQDDQKQIHNAYINGVGDGTFRPNANVTRAQMAKMLARNLSDVDSINLLAYMDVSKTHWAYNDILKAKNAGIMIGTSTDKFNPEGTITRAQMAMIGYRWIQQECKKKASSFDSCASLTSLSQANYKDVSKNHWAVEAIDFMKMTNFMNGYDDSIFKPDEKLTRAQAVKVLNHLFKRDPLTEVKTSTYKDVPTTHWAFAEIEEATREHIFTIDADGKEFRAPVSETVPN